MGDNQNRVRHKEPYKNESDLDCIVSILVPRGLKQD